LGGTPLQGVIRSAFLKQKESTNPPLKEQNKLQLSPQSPNASHDHTWLPYPTAAATLAHKSEKEKIIVLHMEVSK